MLCPARSMLVRRAEHWVKNLVKGHRTLQRSGRVRVSLLAGEHSKSGVLPLLEDLDARR